MSKDIFTMTHQTKQCAKIARKQFEDVLGKSYQLKSGKGRDELLHPATLKESYELALAECPQAADTIAVLLWDGVITQNRLEFLAVEYEKQG